RSIRPAKNTSRLVEFARAYFAACPYDAGRPCPVVLRMQAAIIVIVFFLTYVGMAAGRLPWLQVDRTGIALLGVILLLATEAMTLDQLGATIDTSTLVLLFALMIISAQFVHSGFYDFCAEWLTSRRGCPAWLLATTFGVCG